MRLSCLLALGALAGCAAFQPLVARKAPGLSVASKLPGEPSVALSSDDAGSAVVAFTRAGAVAAQKYDASGAPAWGPEGLALCSACGEPGRLVLERGNGGFYAAWQEPDGAAWRWRVQRFDDSGAVAWKAPVTAGTSSSADAGMDYSAAADGSFLLVWGDKSLTLARIAADGTLSWSREACKGRCQLPKLDWDQTGGAYLSYRGERGLLVQHYSVSGAPLWGRELSVFDGGGYKSPALMLSDAHEGIIMAWEDGRRGTIDVYAQRVSSGGAVLWAEDGVPIASGEANNWSPAMTPDGRGGVHVAWVEDMKASRTAVRARRIDGNGASAGPREGTEAGQSSDSQAFPMAVPDGDKGAFLCWYEARVNQYGVFCQRFGESGQPLWGKDGVTAAEEPYKLTGLRLVSDGRKGAFSAWKTQAPGGWEIRLQRLEASGAAGWR